ncbi:MAG: hypothetical protein KC912_24220 [Proteobacteria bacterium]|nr:hypothetical protein [Pseudomonadota bacterium]
MRRLVVLLCMVACGKPPVVHTQESAEPVDAAEASARAVVAASGWASAVGELEVVRSPRPPWTGDRATQLLADATLAWFDAGTRELHVADAALHGAVWTGAQDAEASALVRDCPAKMLGTTDLHAVMLHELGHAALLSAEPLQRLHQLRQWGALAGWEQAVGRDRGAEWDGEWMAAIGMRGPMLLHEWPETAVRLCSGEPRGEGAFRTSRTDFVSLYAQFDPLEDMAESFRVFHTDPARLAATSPAKYLAIATPSAWGGTAVPITLEDAAMRPGVEALLASAAEVGLEALRAHPTLQAAAADLAQTPYASDAIDVSRWQLIREDGLAFRPPDVFFEKLLAESAERERAHREFQEGIDNMREWGAGGSD